MRGPKVVSPIQVVSGEVSTWDLTVSERAIRCPRDRGATFFGPEGLERLTMELPELRDWKLSETESEEILAHPQGGYLLGCVLGEYCEKIARLVQANPHEMAGLEDSDPFDWGRESTVILCSPEGWTGVTPSTALVLGTHGNLLIIPLEGKEPGPAIKEEAFQAGITQAFAWAGGRTKYAQFTPAELVPGAVFSAEDRPYGGTCVLEVKGGGSVELRRTIAAEDGEGVIQDHEEEPEVYPSVIHLLAKGGLFIKK